MAPRTLAQLAQRSIHVPVLSSIKTCIRVSLLLGGAILFIWIVSLARSPSDEAKKREMLSRSIVDTSHAALGNKPCNGWEYPALLEIREGSMIHGWEHKKIMDVLMTGEYYGNLVLDVGANQAGFTYLGALNGRRVVTFEALQPNIDFIKERLKENYVGPRVKLVHGAVWDTSGLTKYFLDQPEVDFNGQMKPVQNTEGMRPVQTVTIDDHVDEDVQVLKLDVEGCELNALWGAKKLLTTRRVPFIVLEYSPLNIGMVTEGKDPNLVMQFLSDLGYSVYLHVCHRCDRTDLRWPCEHSNLGALPQALLSHDSENSAYAKARRILPSEFREFTQWMYDYVEKPSPQVDLMFFRGRDLPRNVQQH